MSCRKLMASLLRVRTPKEIVDVEVFQDGAFSIFCLTEFCCVL